MVEKYKLEICYVDLPKDFCGGNIEHEDGSFTIFIHNSPSLLEQDQAISHQFTAIRHKILGAHRNNDQPEVQLRLIDLREISEEKADRDRKERPYRLKKAQIEYLKKFPEKGNIAKFYPRDLEELLEVVDQGRLIESLIFALQAGFMIGYRRRSKECTHTRI